MKRFSIKIIETGRDNFDLDDQILLRKEHYDSFIQFVHKDDWEEIMRESIICENCGSYITSSYLFFQLIDDTIYYMNSNEFRGEFEKHEILYGKLEEIIDRMYLEYAEEDDPDNPSWLPVIFNETCSCNSFFVGNSDEEKSEVDENTFYFTDPDIRISRYIGPRLKW